MTTPYDLTTVAAVQAWSPSATAANSAITQTLISQTSRTILTQLNRGSILPTSYTEQRNGNGKNRMVLSNWPVISFQSLVIAGLLIPQAQPIVNGSPYVPGWILDTQPDPFGPGIMQSIWLRGYTFSAGYQGFPAIGGVQSVTLTYMAGYQVTGEAQTVPATPGPYTVAVNAPLGAWGSDSGVTYALTGLPLLPVASSPAQGQYSVAAGVYTFNAADQGAAVLISYGFIPADLALACTQWVGELIAYEDRIGLRSKSLGGQETMAYDTSAIPPRVESAIQPYRRVVMP